MKKLSEFLKNFSYTLGANILSTVIGALVVILIPSFMGVRQYGYWQLYLFYEGYTAYLSLGVTDGVYIKYGGWKYYQLPKEVLIIQFWFLAIFTGILTVIPTVIFAVTGTLLEVKKIVIVYALISSIIVIPRSLLLMVMQTTNRIKEYSICVIVERIFYLFFVLGLLCLNIKSYNYYIYADLGGKIISLVWTVLYCKDIIWGSVKGYLKKGWFEIRENISCGLKIAIAGVIGSLIIGLTRFMVEQNWGVEAFAKISFSLSLSNMLLKLITAVAVVLFPMICRIDEKRLKEIYLFGKKVLSVLILGGCIFYYPIKIILSGFLPQYTESLKYMAILFPICLYESKMQLLGNTFFKALRKEKNILYVNVVVLIISVILNTIADVFELSLTSLMFIIIICMALRACISDVLISSKLNLKFQKNLVLETGMTIMFIVSNWLIGGMEGFAVYLVLYICYFMIQRNDLIIMFKRVKGTTSVKK